MSLNPILVTRCASAYSDMPFAVASAPARSAGDSFPSSTSTSRSPASRPCVFFGYFARASARRFATWIASFIAGDSLRPSAFSFFSYLPTVFADFGPYVWVPIPNAPTP